ncbi:MAG: hypothetical protein MUE30_03655 [Spirosomaceae bacterium]|nr:hypothetical protein [Spirosomataceae bacterium]
MELLEQSSALDRTVQAWGYVTVHDFAREQAKNILLQKMAYYQSKIDFFEQKYGLDFANFCTQFDNIKHHQLFEKEDDSLRWETAIDALESYRLEFQTLNI